MYKQVQVRRAFVGNYLPLTTYGHNYTYRLTDWSGLVWSSG